MTRIGLRLKEAARLGFTSAVISSRERNDFNAASFAGLELIRVTHLDEALAGVLIKHKQK